MEQYSDMQSYSLWEEDYYGMVTQRYPDSNEAPAENYGTDFPIINTDDNHATTQPDAAARNAYHVVSSPETAKGKRRRSKGAAAAQSTTFLNASISNFRALVQQHTGCHSAHSSPKGPITLCFATPASTHTNKLYY